MTSMMKAVVQAGGPGEEDSMTVSDQVVVPVPGEAQILIKVHRAALNRMDLLQRKGLYPVPADASQILGVEVSGFVASVGPGGNGRFKAGDRVMSLLQGGGYAEFAVANEGTTMLASDVLDLDVAAAVPEHLMTAQQLLFEVGRGKRGDSVLLHAGASGVGLAAIQLARRNGLIPFVTCRSDDKVAACMAVGAAAALNVTRPEHVDWVASIKKANGGKGMDMILDPVGQDYSAGNVDLLEPDGRWVIYGLMSGAEMPPMKRLLGTILAKRLTLVGTTLRGRPKVYKQVLAEAVEALVPSIAAKELAVLVAKSFPFTTEGVRASHAMMGRNENIGKIILRVREDDE